MDLIIGLSILGALWLYGRRVWRQHSERWEAEQERQRRT
jgi:hypothetical protein